MSPVPIDVETRKVVYALYAAYLNGDPQGMLALMSDDVEVRFLAQGTFHGIEQATRFFAFAGPLLTDLDFRIERIVVDGEHAAAIWTESATVAATGEPWENHGVDVIRVRDGRIVSLHENNDATLVLKHFPRYVDQG